MKCSKRTLGVLASAALIVGVGVTGAAAVDDSKEVRQSNLINALGAGSQGESDVRSKGHYEFFEEGIHVWTDSNDSQSKVAEYFAPRGGNTAIPSSYTQDWAGDGPRGAGDAKVEPGKQIVFDTDGDRTNTGSYNVLVGEPVYGDQWWLPGGTTKASTNGFTCPETSGGTGSDCHGTLAQWKDELDGAEVYALGFSLGSGVKGDGVIRSQSVTYADAPSQEYIFTDEAATVTPPVQPTVNPAGSTAVVKHGRTVRYNLTTAAVPAGSKTGTVPEFKVTVNDAQRAKIVGSEGETESYWYYCPSGSTCVTKVFKNGTEVVAQRQTIQK